MTEASPGKASKVPETAPQGAPDPTNAAALVEGLLRPEAYSWRPAKVELVETHVSWVFLSGERVVKVKKPVDYGFVDHAALASRRRSCEDEVRLNRRLTDGVYLGVAPIVRDRSGRYRVALTEEHTETPVEWATLMHRLPAEGMLDALLAAKSAPPHLGDRLAERLVPFHRDVAASCEGPADEVVAVASTVVTENMTELEPFAGRPLGSVQLGLVGEAMHDFIAEHASLLRERAVAGWVREGHGDLRTEHICFEPDGMVQVFDCVEFSRSLRCADVASDLAFLLMDFDRLGAPEAAEALVARYRAAGFDLPESLLRFYKGHRALVRAKVACLSRAFAHQAARDDLALEAAEYLNLATADVVTVRPVLVAMTGLSGTGKSTVAAALARALGAPIFSSDIVRKALAGRADPAPAAWEQGLYGPDQTEATYRRLEELAGETLAIDRVAILDATLLDERRRERLAAVAEGAGVPLVLVETVCTERVALGRIVARARRGASPSDATAEVYRRQRTNARTSPPNVPRDAVHVVVDTTAGHPVCLDPVLVALHREGIVAARVPGTEADETEETSNEGR